MIERHFRIPFVARLALAKKEIQQNYRPLIAVHKWFARRPGTLFRALILSEFAGQLVDQKYFHGLLFDRGYPGYEFSSHLLDTFPGYFIFRCPSQRTFPAVEKFVKSGKAEDVIFIAPSGNYLRQLSPRQRKKLKVLKLRIIRLVSRDGTESVLLTNL